MDLEDFSEPCSGIEKPRSSIDVVRADKLCLVKSTEDENEELKQKIKILEEENARLRGELEVPKVDESSATTPTHQIVAPAAQTMDREKENSKSDKYCCFKCCCFKCCINDDKNRKINSNNNGCCCCFYCCCDGGGGGGGGDDCCEGGCDD